MIPLPGDLGPDPYWTEDLWSRPIRWRARPPHETLAGLATDERVCAVAGALAGWRLLSADHLARFGRVSAADLAGVVLPAMWRAGLVERGAFDVLGVEAPALYRLRSGPELSGWLAGLDPAAWLSVTAGEPVGGARSLGRHDLLAAEVGLRASEAGVGLQAVFPESLARPSLLVPGSGSTRAKGDLVIVREDGLRVVVELTASRTPELTAKVARWGRLLAAGDAGLVVVFLTAATPGGDQAGLVRKGIPKAFESVLCPEGLGLAGAWATNEEVSRARKGLAVADWEDWFPGPGCCSTAFPALEARFLVPRSEGRWGTVGLARQYPFEPEDPSEWLWPGKERERVLAAPA
ncbi:MAG: hypothetical protein ACRD0J_17495 [Acidimicrobiales bacterium]